MNVPPVLSADSAKLDDDYWSGNASVTTVLPSLTVSVQPATVFSPSAVGRMA